MAAGVAMAGLAIGVHFSSAPSPKGTTPASVPAESPSIGERQHSTGRVEAPPKPEQPPPAPRPEHRASALPKEPSRPAQPTDAPPSTTPGAAAQDASPVLSDQRIADSAAGLPADPGPVSPPSPAAPPAPKPAPPTDELSPNAPRPSRSGNPSPSRAFSRSEAAHEVARGPAEGKRIALTFDAGSSASPTPAILEALRENGLRCTFFLTGRWTETNPRVVRQIVDAGHELGNHTYNHPDLTRASDEKVIAELQQTEEEVQRVTGRTTKPYFRPPFGARDARVLRLAAAEGYRCIYWTTDSWDSVKKGIRPQEIEERVLRKARPGSIVLMHCGSQATADALPDIIRSLKADGYEIVTVSDLLSGGP